jgi:hypothetical protein
MTDQDLGLRLRAWYGANVPATEPAPPALRATVLAIPRTATRPLLRIDGRRPLALVAAAALVALAVAGAMLVGGVLPNSVVPSPTPRVTELPSATAHVVAPTRSPAPPPIAGMVADWRQVFAASDSVAWVVSSSAAYRTDDLGATWRDVTPPSFGPGFFWPLTIVDADTAYAAPFGTSATIYFTHNGGLDWVASDVDRGPLGGPPTVSFSTPMAGTATFSDGTDAEPNRLFVFTTSDGGTTWARSGSGAIPPLTDGIPKLQGPKGGYMWQSAGKSDTHPFNNRFFLSADGGVTWSQDTFPISAISPRNALKEILDIVPEADGHFLVAFSADGSNGDFGIYESTDDPAAWRLVYHVPDTGFSLQFLTPTTWMLVSTTEIRSTVDAGAHWTSTRPDILPGLWHVHFSTTRTGWARIGGTADPNWLAVTTDGGATWRGVGT